MTRRCLFPPTKRSIDRSVAGGDHKQRLMKQVSSSAQSKSTSGALRTCCRCEGFGEKDFILKSNSHLYLVVDVPILSKRKALVSLVVSEVL